MTKPTLETVLERINLLGESLGGLRDDVGLLRNEFQLFRGEIEIRLDRIESMTNQTRAEMLTLRADFREFKTQPTESANM